MTVVALPTAVPIPKDAVAYTVDGTSRFVVDAKRVSVDGKRELSGKERARLAFEAYLAKRLRQRDAQLAKIRAASGKVQDVQRHDTVPASSVFVDEAHEYIDPINQRHVENIAGQFDWAKFTPILVVRRADGRYAVIDGKHHWRAAQTVHGADVQVPIIAIETHGSREREAEIYDQVNSLRKGKPYEYRFKARLVFGEPTAQGVVSVLKPFGLRLHLERKARGPQDGEVAAPAVLERLYRSVGAAGVRETLTALHGVWGHDVEAYRAPVLLGVFEFIARYHGLYDAGRLRDVMKQLGPDGIREYAQSKAEVLGVRFASRTCYGTDIAYGLYHRYNSGRRGERLPEFTFGTRERQAFFSAVKRYRRALGLVGGKAGKPEDVPAAA